MPLTPLDACYQQDMTNHVVRYVWPNGTITLKAGSYLSGYGGDWGPGTLANMSSPSSVLADGLGGVYIAEVSVKVAMHVRDLPPPSHPAPCGTEWE